MKRRNVLDTKNVIITAQGIVTSLVTSLILIIPLFIANWLIKAKYMLGFGIGIQILSVIVYLWIWGYFANKFWGWN